MPTGGPGCDAQEDLRKIVRRLRSGRFGVRTVSVSLPFTRCFGETSLSFGSVVSSAHGPIHLRCPVRGDELPLTVPQ